MFDNQSKCHLSLIFLAFFTILTGNCQASNTDSVETNSTFVNGYYDCKLSYCNLIDEKGRSLTTIASSFSLILNLLFVCVFLCRREVRKKPNVFIFMMAICSALFSSNLIIQVSRSDISENILLTILSYISLTTTTLINLYSFIFLLYNFISIKKSAEREPISTIYFNFGAWILTFLIVFTFHTFNGLGESIYGLYGLKSSSYMLVPSIGYGVTILISIFMVSSIRNTLFYSVEADEHKGSFIKTYYYTFYWIILEFLMAAIFEILLTIYTKKYAVTPNDTQTKMMIKSVTLLLDHLKSLFPLVLIITCLKDQKAFKRRRNNRSNVENLISGEFSDESVSHDLVHIQEAERKIRQIYSLLAGVNLFFNQPFDGNILKDLENNKPQVIGHMKIAIDEKIIKDTAPQIFSDGKSKVNSFSTGELKVYRPAVFTDLMRMGGIRRELIDSLNFAANNSKIISWANRVQDSDRDFFVTSDGKFTLRVIKGNEKKSFLNILTQYAEYLKANNESILFRIYGVWRLTVDNPKETIYLILVRRICENSEAVARRYELKGTSMYSSIPDQEESNVVSNSKVDGLLKDSQFDKVEKKLKVDQNIAISLLETISQDVYFLSSVKISGYCLAVYIVDAKYRLRDLGLSIIQETDEDKETPKSRQASVLRGELELTNSNFSSDSKKSSLAKKLDPFKVSSTTEGIYYKVGITNYFQSDNVQTIFGTFLKANGDNRQGMPISPVSDKDYALRLISYAAKILGRKK